MIIKCFGETHEYILFMDIEFSKNELVQFAGLLFKQIDDETYQLMRSINQYVTTKVCYPFMEYTHITNTFLQENGIPIQDVVYLVQEDFLGDINLNQILVVSHGLKNDRAVLSDAGINLISCGEKPIDGYCTFNNARRILNRTSCVKLSDLADEAGYYLHNAHNAYEDAWATVAVFTFLKKIEQQKKGEI